MATRRPGLLDRLDLMALRLVKAGRAKRAADDTFYEGFFTADDVEKYLSDVRNTFRFRRAGAAYRDLFDGGAAQVADIGAGLGIARRFLPPAADYLGVEFSAETIALAALVGGDRPGRLVEGGFPHLPVEDGWADLVLCLEVIEHVADDRQAIAELRRILRPGGYLLLSVPGTWYWPDYLRLIGHYRHYTREALAVLLDSAGLEIVRGYAQFDGFWRGYHYLYLMLKAFELALRKTVRPNFSVLRTGLYRRIARAAERWIAARDPADDPRSTFVLCRRERAAS
jgi:SAM-dependent methyltransferase